MEDVVMVLWEFEGKLRSTVHKVYWKEIEGKLRPTFHKVYWKENKNY